MYSNFPNMTPAEVIKALATINRIRAEFTLRPLADRRPIYQLPHTPKALARAINADFATPKHAIYDCCTVADCVAEIMGTGWSGVDVIFSGERAVGSGPMRRIELTEDERLADDNPADPVWGDHIDSGVRWSPELAKLARLLHALYSANPDQQHAWVSPVGEHCEDVTDYVMGRFEQMIGPVPEENQPAFRYYLSIAFCTCRGCWMCGTCPGDCFHSNCGWEGQLPSDAAILAAVCNMPGPLDEAPIMETDGCAAQFMPERAPTGIGHPSTPWRELDPNDFERSNSHCDCYLTNASNCYQLRHGSPGKCACECH
ncbi:MAG: hypothetical protein ACJ74Q_15715 [Pyrinomonadaceae bacterium]